jgi:hypothetical protein
MSVTVVLPVLIGLVQRADGQPEGWKTYENREKGNLTKYWYPANWAASGHSGMADVYSPNGAGLNLGISAPVTTPEGWQQHLAVLRAGLAGLPPAQAQMFLQRQINQELANNPVGIEPYRTPLQVVTQLLPKMTAKSQTPLTDPKIAQTVNLPPPQFNPTKMQSCIFRWSYNLNNTPYRGIIHVSTAWVQTPNQWMFYYSACGAPAQRFAQDLPTLLGIWKSYLSLTVRQDWASEPVRNRLEEMERQAEAWDDFIRQ